MTEGSTGAPGPAGSIPRRIRLLLMTNSVQMGGLEEHVRLLAKEIDRERFEVVGWAPDWPATEQFSRSLDDACDRFAHVTPDGRHGRGRQIREAFRVISLARRERFDVAHLHGTSYHGLSMAIVALRLGGVRRIFLTEHLAPEQPVSRSFRWRRSMLMRLVTGLVCVSDNNREARERNLGAPEGRTHVVNNGIDVSRFDAAASSSDVAGLRADLGIANDSLVVGTAIRFEPGKGVADLVRGFAAVHSRHPHAVLLMVGDGSLRGELEDLAHELGVAQSVRFGGFQPDPRPYIRLMDVFVLPVPFGSASIALLEAMAMSRPCVITFGGYREAVQHGVSGFCARPNDPSSIAEFVNELFDDEIRRLEMGRTARVRVETDYSAQRVARELEHLYTA